MSDNIYRLFNYIKSQAGYSENSESSENSNTPCLSTQRYPEELSENTVEYRGGSSHETDILNIDDSDNFQLLQDEKILYPINNEYLPSAPSNQSHNSYNITSSGNNCFSKSPANSNFTKFELHSRIDSDGAKLNYTTKTNKKGLNDVAEQCDKVENSVLTQSNEDVWRLMMGMFGKKNSSTMNINECSELLHYINQWKITFQRFDKDESGYIEYNELMLAFQHMGYRFSPTFVQNLLSKYDSGDEKLTLDQFILVCVRIQSLTDGFRLRDHAKQGAVVLQYEDFIGLALGVHK